MLLSLRTGQKILIKLFHIIPVKFNFCECIINNFLELYKFLLHILSNCLFFWRNLNLFAGPSKALWAYPEKFVTDGTGPILRNL